MMNRHETRLREQIALHGESLHARGLVPGSSGNISAFLEDGLLVTPTNSCLGRLDPARISKLDWKGNHIDGDQPSKEGFLHLLMYGKRPGTRACVHLHSTHAVAVSCCDGLDKENAIPPLTPYYVMKIGRLPLIPYFMPGDETWRGKWSGLPGIDTPCCWPTMVRSLPEGVLMRRFLPWRNLKSPPGCSCCSGMKKR